LPSKIRSSPKLPRKLDNFVKFRC